MNYFMCCKKNMIAYRVDNSIIKIFPNKQTANGNTHIIIGDTSTYPPTILIVFYSSNVFIEVRASLSEWLGKQTNLFSNHLPRDIVRKQPDGIRKMYLKNAFEHFVDRKQ